MSTLSTLDFKLAKSTFLSNFDVLTWFFKSAFVAQLDKSNLQLNSSKISIIVVPYIYIYIYIYIWFYIYLILISSFILSYSFGTLFIKTNSSWLIFEQIKALEIRT